MRTSFAPIQRSLATIFVSVCWLASVCSASSDAPSTSTSFADLGAKVTADYRGDAISVTPTADGARLQCGFQKLKARATREGLWITSMEAGDKFRVVAGAVARIPDSGLLISDSNLAHRGEVRVMGQAASFIRTRVVEEYSVSVDGVRQDFVLLERPAGEGELALMLDVSGARAEAAAGGARLVLSASGRVIAYTRLHVTDATGRELTANLDAPGANLLRIRVDDTSAVYPVRVDPTFSDADWVSLNGGTTGTNGIVRAVVVDGGGSVFIGGSFTVVGSAAISGVAKWNGSAWSGLGSGIDGSVGALVLSGTELYAGGSFTTAGGGAASNIAKWNGSTWSALGTGTSQAVNALAVSGSDLYAGGQFNFAGGILVRYIAKWNGSAWSALEAGVPSGPVYSLHVSGTDLYMGGSFSTVDGVPANRIAKWNRSSWSALGTGLTGIAVRSIVMIGTDLYAGGQFTAAGGVAASNIAKWNGSAWSALGSGLNSDVYSLAVSGTEVYAGGSFTSAGALPASYVARWNGSAWSALGAGMGPAASPFPLVYALKVSGGQVFAGGSFTTADGATVNNIARWNGSAWSPFGTGMGMEAAVRALLVSGTDLYAGGSFTTASGTVVNRIAKWNGSVWAGLGSGMNGDVLALTLNGGNLYAGGDFTTAGGISANRIARWNGSAWAPLTASGINGTVNALTSIGTDVFAGGGFSTAGGAPASRIAKWSTTGSSWSALGTGTNATVNALTVMGTDLFVGGSFDTAGGVTVNCVAKWNGSAWSTLGSGMGVSSTVVYALAASGTDIYAGGSFTTAGGAPVANVAKWNGSSWSALGTGLPSNRVYALAVRGTEVFAGGANTAFGAPGNYVAMLRGGVWSPLGSGLDNTVRALALDSANHLFVGGDFVRAGANVSPFIAQANIPTPNMLVEQPVSSVIGDGGAQNFGAIFSGGVNLAFTIRNPGTDDLTGLTITKDGANAADFVVTVNPVAPVAPMGSTTFAVQFAPTASGTRSAALHIASNADAAGKSPYDINLSGQAYLLSLDTDGDGLNDGAEFQMSALGFNWQSSQTALVNTLFNNIGGAQSNLNAAGYYSTTQVQALNAPAPLIQRDAGGVFTITLGLEKSTNLTTFTPFPMAAPQCIINGAGKLEFQFTVPDNVAFFRLGAQ